MFSWANIILTEGIDETEQDSDLSINHRTKTKPKCDKNVTNKTEVFNVKTKPI
jgi:hypothetical protein